jgi:ATP-dependent HslUV protease ATP-binding subunit HslU
MEKLDKHNLTPQEIVAQLDKYIIGQDNAKHAVAVALRNRYRRSRLTEEMQREVTPKNIIMVGPTGVGKTEIARRLARLVQSPFVKVEATKFTEVGYVGRDVESMIRDLIENAVRLVREQKMKSVEKKAEALAQKRLLDILVTKDRKESRPSAGNVLGSIFGNAAPPPPPKETPEEAEQKKSRRDRVYSELADGKLEDVEIEIEVEDTGSAVEMMPGSGMEINISEMMGNMMPKKYKRRVVTVSAARNIFKQEEAGKLIDMDQVKEEARDLTEKHGIVFIDEIDKITGRGNTSGPDVSRQGVQRDILPLVEGSTVSTKYGAIKTDYILFIAAGAFHISSVSDLIPELQGRFPIKVELASLTKDDFKSILTQPKNALTLQYKSLLEVDNVELEFDDSAIEKIAELAFMVNETTENIGARRLHTIMEHLLEDISFNANGEHPVIDLKIDDKYVTEHLKTLIKENDLERFII